MITADSAEWVTENTIEIALSLR